MNVRSFLAILGLLLPIAAQAQMGLPDNIGATFVPVVAPTTCTKPGFVDGCPGAPAGAPQLSTILSSYVAPPPWNVAGVDYATGFPNGTALADPATISMTGVTVNAGAHTVTISGNNVTLTGYDFGLANGWAVTVNGTNDTIQNSRFKVGSNQGSPAANILNVTTSASNFSLLANEVDGNNVTVTAFSGQTISISSSGTLTIQYNYLHNSGGDMIDFNTVPSAVTSVIRYNLFRDIGITTMHADPVQFAGTNVAASLMEFNTVYQSGNWFNGNGLLMNGPSEGATSNIRNATTRNNTLISLAACVTCNWAVGYYQDSGGTGSNLAVYANYVDPTGINVFTASPWYSPNRSGSGGFTGNITTPAAYYGLTNMVNGAAIPVPSRTAATSQGYYVYPDAANLSPSLSAIYTMTPSPATGNVVTGSTVTFSLAMVAPSTVTGTPTLTLNDGGTASYVSGSGTATLVFSHTVAAGNAAATLAVTAVNGTIKDAVGNTLAIAPLTNIVTSFAGLSVNNGVGNTLAFTTLNGGLVSSVTTGSGTYTGSAPSGLVSPVTFGGGCSGSSTVTGFGIPSAGSWNATFSTPSTPCTGTITSVTGTGSNTSTTGPSPSATFSTAATVFRTADFINSIGMNTHMGYLGTPYADIAVNISDLQYLGVSHIRDLYPVSYMVSPYETVAAAGMQFDLILTDYNEDACVVLSANLALVNSLATGSPGSIASVEGPNETNSNPGVRCNGVSAGDPNAFVAVQIMQAIYPAVKSDTSLAGVPVINLSVSNGIANWQTYTNNLGNLDADADQGNWHIYFFPGGSMPAASFTQMIPFAKQSVPGKPFSVTESGYYTAYLDTTQQGGVDQPTQAKDVLDILVDGFSQGVKTTYIYELMDGIANPPLTDVQNSYGVMLSNGSPKPAGTAIHNLTTILADTGPTARTFTPAPLSYSIPSPPPLGNSLLLQKSTGTYELAVWAEPQNWNPNTMTPITVSPVNTMVNLGRSFTTVKVYDPTAGTPLISTLSNVSSVTLGITDHPLIVEMITSPTSCPDDDGSAGATLGTPNFPNMLAPYTTKINGTNGLGCKVAGVDYRVGTSATQVFKVFGVNALPAGVSINGNLIEISGNNVVMDGWDFTGKQAHITGNSPTITNSKFSITSPACLAEIFWDNFAGVNTVTHNSFDEHGDTTCTSIQPPAGFSAGIYMNVKPAQGATLVFEWNDEENTISDAIGITGTNGGVGLAVIHKFNLIRQQGWAWYGCLPNNCAHADGWQFSQGTVNGPIFSHNTYQNTITQNNPPQPVHTEAQGSGFGTAGIILNAVVSYNTVLTPGTCNNYPTGCTANFDIACKADGGSNVNSGFRGFGNYIDGSGVPVGQILSKGACTSTIWGTPQSNWDMKNNVTLTTNPPS